MKTEQQFHTFTNTSCRRCRAGKKNIILSVNAELHIVPAISLLTLCLKDNNMVSEKEKVPSVALLTPYNGPTAEKYLKPDETAGCTSHHERTVMTFSAALPSTKYLQNMYMSFTCALCLVLITKS